MKISVPFLLMLAALPVAAQTMDPSSSTGPAAAAKDERLGTVSFSVTCATSSQAPFNRGVALLHDFWYEEARSQFDRLANLKNKSVPDCP
jgi:hypothetical protein